MTYVSPSTGCEIKAVLFDTFGSVVDWRSGVARDVAAFAKRHRIGVDAVAFADAWRAKYEPSMEPIRNRSREFVPLDQLHMENLHATVAEFGLNAADFDDRDIADLNAAWERLDPWQDSVAGLAELGRHVIVGPLSNANLALLLRMALRAKLPWTVMVGSKEMRSDGIRTFRQHRAGSFSARAWLHELRRPEAWHPPLESGRGEQQTADPSGSRGGDQLL
jgi:2-haloacid dehalogenase